jgi:hypothetical protein
LTPTDVTKAAERAVYAAKTEAEYEAALERLAQAREGKGERVVDILVTFEDGTTEMRAADSRAVIGSHGVSPEVLVHVNGSALLGFRGEAVCVKRDGVWTRCTVESADEQIARLTRERDEALRVAAAWEKDYGAELARAEGLVRALVKEQTRADAAEGRLADLRTWAKSESLRNEALGDDPVNHAYAATFAAVVRCIDGKETT